MASRTQRQHLIRNYLLLFGIVAFMHFSQMLNALPDLSRTLVVLVAKLLNISAADQGHEIQLGALVLPWNQDCSGFQILVFLLAGTFWANRESPLGFSLLTRLILCLPIALAANILRIFCIAGYRYLYYPEWESPQLHYFMGFVCALPFLILMVPRFQYRSISYWLELLYMASVFALVAPLVFSPGGSLVTLCAFFFLARGKYCSITSWQQWLVLLFWLLAAVLIVRSQTESLWLPWLLLAPQFLSRDLLRSVSGGIILTGTIPLLAMHTLWQVVVLAALLVEAYRLYNNKPVRCANETPGNGLSVGVGVTGLVAPFFLSQLIGVVQLVESPPRGVMAQQLSLNSYTVRSTGQTPDIASFWFGAFADGRHHSLVSCMEFRGIKLQPVKHTAGTYSGEGKWMTEYFIHEGELIYSYPDYLLATFSPFSSPGVHLIYEADSTTMSANYFKQESNRMVRALMRLTSRQ